LSITSVIITKNEAENIALCIESVSSFSDEIIILDSYSQDDTEKIARSFPKVKFYQRHFDNYIAQKNFANELVSSNYILSLDADECADSSLISFIQTQTYQNFQAISFRRINYIGNQSIQYGLWSRDVKIRLWKKGLAYWAGTIPHEHLVLKAGKQIYKSSATIRHRAYKNEDSLYLKSMNYARLAAQLYTSRFFLLLIISIIINPVFKFFKGYIWLQGYRDGSMGWAIAKVSALETFYKYFYALKWKWR
jgi:glycosyltransferase involved in cell wall biosynthesis